MTLNYVSEDQYAATVARMQARQKSVALAHRKLEKAKTLAEKIAAQRALKAARDMFVF